MNEHAGPASALSVLIIGLFAVLLHDRHQPSAQASPRTSASSPTKVTESLTQKREPNSVPSTRSVIDSRVAASELPPIKSAVANRPEPIPMKPADPVMPAAPAKVLAKAPAPPISPTPAQSPFTVVQAGEKLVDIAIRVYGTPDQAESLWRANRDQVALLDSKLTQGTLLRTP